MKKHFYSEIVSIETIRIELESMDLSKEETVHLIELAEETLHHAIIDMILSHLSEIDKRVFLMYIIENEHEKIWDHIDKNVSEAKVKITDLSKKIEQMLLDDLKEIRK